MIGKDIMVRHLSEWILRQYDYVQTVPKPLTTIGPLEPEEVVTTFVEFVVHVLSQQERGDPVSEDEGWKHSNMKWFYKVSNPIMIALTAILDYTFFCPFLRGGYC